LTNAPGGILNSSISISSTGVLSGGGGGTVTLTGLGYTIPTYDLIGGTKPAADADKTSTILGDTGTLTLNAALTINSLLTISGSAAGITSGLASYSSDGTGFWISKDTSNSRMRVGTVSAGVLTNGFVWDGTAFKVKGEIQATSGTFEGNINSSATITGGTIVGGTLKTASTGKRFTVGGTEEAIMYDATDTAIAKMGEYGFYSNLKAGVSWSYNFEGVNAANFGDGCHLTKSGYGGVVGYFKSTSTDSTYNVSAVLAESANGDGVDASGAAGYYDFYAYGAGTNGPFTGSHDAIIDMQDPATQGDIIADILIINRRDVSNCISEVALVHEAHSPALGVLTYRRPLGRKVPAALTGAEPVLYELDQANKEFCIVNSLGEGQINVCKDGGAIRAGDYICSSTRPGKGMRQSDDLLHNYTVAKARESCVWQEGEDDIRMIACTYHCG